TSPQAHSVTVATIAVTAPTQKGSIKHQAITRQVINMAPEPHNPFTAL
ncbi:unnamed protein product, partial [marine sediment metagenome]